MGEQEGLAKIRTYYTESRARYLSASIAFALLALIAFVISIQSHSDLIKSILVGALGVLALVVALFPLMGSRSRIVTSPQGLVYHTVGFSISTTWDNIDHIAQISIFQDVRHPVQRILLKEKRMGFAGHLEGLVLCQPVNIETSFWERSAAGPQRHIILSVEFKRWREGGLAKDLKQYAPHLFAQEKTRRD